uniref:Uncharacterized protein n=1 Tax=Scleropages formosus TaxID=113540 RepID=A0A8C9RLZ3_SCLFO
MTSTVMVPLKEHSTLYSLPLTVAQGAKDTLFYTDSYPDKLRRVILTFPLAIYLLLTQQPERTVGTFSVHVGGSVPRWTPC